MSPDSPDAVDLLAAVRLMVAAFRELAVDYFVGGSIASTVFGEPRLTLDADIVARLHPGHGAALVQHLGAAFYRDSAAIETAIAGQRVFNVIHLATMVKVDVYVASADPFVRSQFARRLLRTVGLADPIDVYLATPEDTVLAKLDWYRKGAEIADRQWRDVLGVLKVQGRSLDFAYLREWAAHLLLTELLDRALDEAGLKAWD